MKITAVAVLCSSSLALAQGGTPHQEAASSRGASETSELHPGAAVAQTAIDSLSASELQAAINDLKANYFKPDQLGETDLKRALLSGILSRLTPGVFIRTTGTDSAQPAEAPFKAETLKTSGKSISYFRLGSLNKANLEQLDLALKGAATESTPASILDLRATPESNDFELAAEVLRRFCPKGSPLFSIKKPGLSSKEEDNRPSGSDREIISAQEPVFQGPLMVLVDGENAGAPEIIAASLRLNTKAIIIGEKTKGEGVEFADFSLGANKTLRIAVAEVVLREGAAIYPQGVTPDILVEAPLELQHKVLAQALEKGISGLVFETERPRTNEASLVAGTTPELDALQIAQKASAEKESPLHDLVLQRAVDLITSIGIFEGNK